jgi:O-antigen/teichoic acid export membrane protein
MDEKPLSRKRRLAINSVFSFFSWLVPLMVSFVATPIIVRGLGIESYGLYALISGFISYSFSFGIGKTAAKYVAEYSSAGQTAKISEVLSTIFWFSLSVGLLGTVIIAVFARSIVSDVLQISPDAQPLAITALYLACVTILVYMISQIFQFALQGLHRFDKYSILINLNGILMNGGNILIVWRGGGVLSLLGWNLTVVCLICILFYISARRLIPGAGIRFKLDREMTIDVLKYGASIILYQVFGNLLLIFERGWITRKLGPHPLTFYVVPMSIGIYLHGFISSLVLVLFPFVNELLADKDKLTMLYQKANKIAVAIVAFSVLTMVCGGKLFLNVWIGEDFAEGAYNVLVIHIFTFGILAVMTISWQLAEGFGYAGLNAISTFTWVIISVPLMIFSAEHWHNEGIAFSRLIGVIATVPLIFYIEGKFLKNIDWKYWLKLLVCIAAAAAGAVVIEKLIFTRETPTWLGLFAGAGAGAAIYLIILLATGFLTREERTMLRDMLPGR